MRTAVDDSDDDSETRGRAKGYAGLRVTPDAQGPGESGCSTSWAWRRCATIGRLLRRICSRKFSTSVPRRGPRRNQGPRAGPAPRPESREKRCGAGLSQVASKARSRRTRSPPHRMRARRRSFRPRKGPGSSATCGPPTVPSPRAGGRRRPTTSTTCRSRCGRSSNRSPPPSACRRRTCSPRGDNWVCSTSPVMLILG